MSIAPIATDRPLAIAENLAWTPEALKQEVEREKQLRIVVIDYYKSQLQQGHHYYNLPGQGENRKPALAKEGALNLCSLFKVIPEPDEPHELITEDGHYSVRFRYRLRSMRTGQIVATGDGFCTSREEKYAFRFASRSCPVCDVEAVIKGKEEYGGGWICFKKKGGCGAKFADGDAAIEGQKVGKVPNELLPDTYNTILKMASKRALVDAALKLPLVSELFTQDLEEQIAQREEPDEPAERDAGGSPSAGSPTPHHPKESPPPIGTPPVTGGKSAPFVCEKCGTAVTAGQQTLSQHKAGGKTLCPKHLAEAAPQEPADRHGSRLKANSGKPVTPPAPVLTPWQKLESRREALGVTLPNAKALSAAFLAVPYDNFLTPSQIVQLDRLIELFSEGGRTIEEAVAAYKAEVGD